MLLAEHCFEVKCFRCFVHIVLILQRRDICVIFVSIGKRSNWLGGFLSVHNFSILRQVQTSCAFSSTWPLQVPFFSGTKITRAFQIDI